MSDDRELQEVGEEARQRITFKDRQLHLMLCGVFSRIKAGDSRGLHPQIEGAAQQT
jgi:copper(I)-binding protein